MYLNVFMISGSFKPPWLPYYVFALSDKLRIAMFELNPTQLNTYETDTKDLSSVRPNCENMIIDKQPFRYAQCKVDYLKQVTSAITTISKLNKSLNIRKDIIDLDPIGAHNTIVQESPPQQHLLLILILMTKLNKVAFDKIIELKKKIKFHKMLMTNQIEHIYKKHKSSDKNNKNCLTMRMAEEATFDIALLTQFFWFDPDDVRISIGSRGFVPVEFSLYSVFQSLCKERASEFLLGGLYSWFKKAINKILDPNYVVMGIIFQDVVAKSSMFSGDKYQECSKHPLDIDFSLIQVKTSLQKNETSARTL
ncbi:hypothetical protein U3516DRAFT_738287 [Neocallimastix sp. 'constans']